MTVLVAATLYVAVMGLALSEAINRAICHQSELKLGQKAKRTAEKTEEYVLINLIVVRMRGTCLVAISIEAEVRTMSN